MGHGHERAEQRHRGEGAPSIQRTEVRVLFSATGVSVGAVLFDERPDQI